MHYIRLILTERAVPKTDVNRMYSKYIRPMLTERAGHKADVDRMCST